MNKKSNFSKFYLFSLKKFKQIKNQFTNNSLLQKEFENIGINSLNIWNFIEAKLQQEWAKIFSYLCQKSNIDQKLIDEHLQNFENTYLSQLLHIMIAVDIAFTCLLYKDLCKY